MRKLVLVTLCITVVGALVVSCSKLEPAARKDDELLDGPVYGLTQEQTRRFVTGDLAFNDDIFTSAKGLGSIFVATSCGSCHARDGKGHPFTTLTRFGQTDSTGNKFLNNGGPQLQDRALPGYVPETIPAGATFSKFTPPANTGLGFIELVSEADIMAMSDPNDANGDGIRGVPNWSTIPSFINLPPTSLSRNGKYICRFGKKANAFNLLHQTANAYNQDMGITSSFQPSDVYSGLDIDPEVTNKTVNAVVFYLQTLKAPIQRSQKDADVMTGKNLFININCSGCHRPELKSGYSPIASLSYKTFAPYTDLLLHDMGPALDDGYTEGTAKTGAWRTPPLWGLGLSPNSQGGEYFLLHDGRAKSIEAAIQLHGGEAGNSKNSFNTLSETDRQKLIKFLKSL
ncbi:MAG: di-heme oxidoredictase family protein [Chitinophagaceae bacterium]